MHRAQRPYHRPLFDRHVPAQRRAIHEHGMILNHAIVPDVRVGHDQQMAADLSQASALHRAAIDGHTLADFVVIADLQPRRLALVGDILRRHANGAEGEEDIIGSDLRRPVDRHMRLEAAILAQFDLRANHAIRSDFAGRRNLRARIDNRRGM